MSKQEHKEWLLDQIKVLSEHLKEGRYDEIDLSAIEKEASAMARNFGEVIDSLESAGQKMGMDSNDLPTITEHLAHISETTEKGVLTALNTTEAIMDEAAKAKESLVRIRDYLFGNEELKHELLAVNGRMDTVQDHCFTVITSLEFEDINRQVMEKVLTRLNVLYDNLLKILAMLKFKERIEKRDTSFLDSLKHIIDIEGANRQSQDMVDDLFEDFGL
jgi:chemotaxis regulatin CheY-phosphate phosphatase CheZ